MLRPGVAVILDTETTGLTGSIIEIAVLDAATGQTLLHSLIDPQIPIEAAATAVHGITDLDVAGAPRWSEILPDLTHLTRGRQILAYNADFDLGRIAAANHAAPEADPDLTANDRWNCLMLARSAWLSTPRFLPLNGPHRALADTHAARQLLIDMTSRRRQISGTLDLRIGRLRRLVRRAAGPIRERARRVRVG